MAQAQSERARKGQFSFYLVNDLFAGTDRYYTNGVKLAWISPDSLYELDGQTLRKSFSFFIGQNIYTPDNITRRDLNKEDRPYAGISYIGAGFYIKHHRYLDTLECILGIVGPHSYAEQVQKIIHKIFGADWPNGWQNQLKDEFVLELICDRRWKVMPATASKGFGYDVVAHAGGGLGTVITASNIGVEARVGWNIPDDFGSFLTSPGGESTTFFERHDASSSSREKFGFHLFASLETHVVLRNIFLDGNTFRMSHRVDKNPVVWDVVLGVALRVGRFKISYAYLYRSKQFKTQKRNQIFGALNLFFSY